MYLTLALGYDIRHASDTAELSVAVRNVSGAQRRGDGLLCE
jgi:hypothetical protein